MSIVLLQLAALRAHALPGRAAVLVAQRRIELALAGSAILAGVALAAVVF